MSNTTVNGIYGQRMADPRQLLLDDDVDFVLTEISINRQSDAAQIGTHYDSWQKRLGQVGIVPALAIDSQVLDSAMVISWTNMVSRLKGAGVSKIAIVIDEDSQVLRRLSPRFSDELTQIDLASGLSRLIETISKEIECLVSLTIEELCPGGLDPTDGIRLAKQFIEAGACGIIGSGGSIDFPMLKNRRPTRQKSDRHFALDQWSETWMSSALWLVNAVNVPIFAQGPVENREGAQAAVTGLGLAGIINTSVKDPSSLQTMAMPN